MLSEQELLYTLALQHVPKVGDITAKKLLAKCGSAVAIFNENNLDLLKIDGIGTVISKAIKNKNHLKAAEEELKFIKNQDINWHYFKSESYPEKLKHCVDGPILLFSTGAIAIKNQPIISIVGTRKITTNGIRFCEELVEQLASFNPIIVSGFAYGTDITAQKAALKNKLQTIGCLAHGFNQMYPKAHKKYVTAVEKNGGFFTDFWSSDTFDRTNFLKRNRIIAGLSEATIIIESAIKGGSLVTADIANSYNRDVFAVPGRVTDLQSVGCNNLIKQQKAHILTTPLDIPYLLNWKVTAKEKAPIPKKIPEELTTNEKKIYTYLTSHKKQLLDTIALQCDLPVFKTASILLQMELKGVVRPLPGKYFEAL